MREISAGLERRLCREGRRVGGRKEMRIGLDRASFDKSEKDKVDETGESFP